MNLKSLLIILSLFELFYNLAVAGDDSKLDVEGNDPAISSSTPSHDLHSEINSRYEVLQLKLPTFDTTTLDKSISGLDIVMSGIRKAAAGVIGVGEDAIILISLEKGDKAGLLIKFTVEPASQDELDSYSRAWSDAIKNKNKIISSSFDDTEVDWNYPATELTGVTTTTTPITTNTEKATSSHIRTEEAGSSSDGVDGGIIAGIVLGSVAAVGVVGGAGYYAKKKYEQKKNEQMMASQRRQLEERSPGAENISPHGLSNINVQGETTPNPHNYH